jgi:hypothetical protein
VRSNQSVDAELDENDSSRVFASECKSGDSRPLVDLLDGGVMEQERRFDSLPDPVQLDDQQTRVARLSTERSKSVDQKTLHESVNRTNYYSPGLPEAYQDLLEPQPVSRRRMTPQENHSFFSQDSRDESWAYTMELGIKQFLAANQNSDGALIEYVECRSRMCEVAGVVHAGGQDDFSDQLEAMRQSGWWQLSNSHSTAGANIDGVYRFVTFIPRDSDDTLIEEFAASICD